MMRARAQGEGKPMDLLLTVRGADGAAAVYRFAGPEVRVGRDMTCQVRLPSPSVSALHVRLLQRPDGQWQAVDVGSTHGTLLGTRRLVAGEVADLREGDALRVGAFVVEIWTEAAGGLTTGSQDTARLARLLARDAASAASGGWRLWVDRGATQDTWAPLAPEGVVWIGSDPECDLVVPEAKAARQVCVRRTAEGVVFEAPEASVRWRGRRASVGRLGPDERLGLGAAVVRLQAPPGALVPAGGARPWSWGDRLLLGASLAALLAAAVLWLR